MPVHDWTRVDAGLFHSFHQALDRRFLRCLERGRTAAGLLRLGRTVDPGADPGRPDLATLSQ